MDVRQSRSWPPAVLVGHRPQREDGLVQIHRPQQQQLSSARAADGQRHLGIRKPLRHCLGKRRQLLASGDLPRGLSHHGVSHCLLSVRRSDRPWALSGGHLHPKEGDLPRGARLPASSWSSQERLGSASEVEADSPQERNWTLLNPEVNNLFEMQSMQS